MIGGTFGGNGRGTPVRKLNKQFNELVMTFSDGEYR